MLRFMQLPSFLHDQNIVLTRLSVLLRTILPMLHVDRCHPPLCSTIKRCTPPADKFPTHPVPPSSPPLPRCSLQRLCHPPPTPLQPRRHFCPRYSLHRHLLPARPGPRRRRRPHSCSGSSTQQQQRRPPPPPPCRSTTPTRLRPFTSRLLSLQRHSRRRRQQ